MFSIARIAVAAILMRKDQSKLNYPVLELSFDRDGKFFDFTADKLFLHPLFIESLLYLVLLLLSDLYHDSFHSVAHLFFVILLGDVLAMIPWVFDDFLQGQPLFWVRRKQFFNEIYVIYGYTFELGRWIAFSREDVPELLLVGASKLRVMLIFGLCGFERLSFHDHFKKQAPTGKEINGVGLILHLPMVHELGSIALGRSDRV